MKATPIAQYLEQKSRAATAEWQPSRQLSPFKLKPTLASSQTPSLPRALEEEEEEDSPPLSAFRRSGLIAAIGSRPAAAAEPLREAETPRRESVFFRQREAPPPAPDIEARLSEAYHRGVQEGLDTAREEAATARALERAELQKQAVVDQLDFQMNEYAKLGETISAGLGDVEKRISEVVARILQPFVTEAISTQIVEELAENIARLRQSGRPNLLRVRGPERLLSLLKARIAAFAIEVEYVADEGVEVIVEADDTTISSELGPWAELIASLIARE